MATQSFLKDAINNRLHDLTSLLEKSGNNITIGRFGNGNVIELGRPGEMEEAATVSRKHATIKYMEGFYIKDEHSSNGTRVNGKMLRADSYFLKDDDELWFGKYGPVFYREIKKPRGL